jgi:hypothetical protein
MPRNPDKIDYSRGFPKNFEAFEELTDTRGNGHTKHHFGEIIFMVYTHPRQSKAKMPDSIGDSVVLLPLEMCRGSGLKLIKFAKSLNLIR